MNLATIPSLTKKAFNPSAAVSTNMHAGLNPLSMENIGDRVDGVAQIAEGASKLAPALETSASVLGKAAPVAMGAQMGYDALQLAKNPSQRMGDFASHNAESGAGLSGGYHRAVQSLAQPITAIATAGSQLGQLGSVTAENAYTGMKLANPSSPLNKPISQPVYGKSSVQNNVPYLPGQYAQTSYPNNTYFH
jgi:hypothetical protein